MDVSTGLFQMAQQLANNATFTETGIVLRVVKNQEKVVGVAQVAQPRPHQTQEGSGVLGVG